MRPTGPKAEAPPAASRVNMSEYQNTPSPSRLTARNTIRTGAMRTAPLKRMHSAESRRRRRSSPDSSLDMDGLLAHRVDPGTTRSGDGAQHALQIVERPAPGCRFGGTPCFGPQAQPQVGVSREPGGRLDERGAVVERREQCAIPLAIASRVTLPKVSVTLGKRKMSAEA